VNVAIHLQVVGALNLLLASLHFVFPRRFGWKQDLAKLSTLNRDIFIVHCVFIVLVLLLFGGLSLFGPHLLLGNNALSAVVLAGLLVFWTVRLYAQWFVYSPEIWRGRRFETAMHWLFTAMWLYYVVTYAAALRTVLERL
jgi:hypothetical protein